MYEPFNGITDEYGNTARIILSSDQGQPAMRIESTDGYIYITKEQAMKFFGLVDPEDIDDSANERHRAYFSHR